METEKSLETRDKESALLEFIDKIENLIQFQEKIHSPSEITQIWEVFLGDLRKLMLINGCALFLVDETTHDFVLKNVWPQDKERICRKELDGQIECGVFSWIVNRKRPALIPSLACQENKTVILLPLSTTKKTLGVILGLTPIEESSVTRENTKLLALLTRQCALVMENSLLYDNLRNEHESLKKANEEITALSVTDSLTGCYNRRYLTERLTQEIKRARRYGSNLSIILCDIDLFKNVNDTYGHRIGDQVLIGFVKRVTESIRTDVDWLARYGGEEFAIVLPETDVKNACVLAERLRSLTAAEVIRTEGTAIGITASFGVTGITPELSDKSTSLDAMLNAADKYLYQAKREGRNKVIDGPFSPRDD